MTFSEFCAKVEADFPPEQYAVSVDVEWFRYSGGRKELRFKLWIKPTYAPAVSLESPTLDALAVGYELEILRRFGDQSASVDVE